MYSSINLPKCPLGKLSGLYVLYRIEFILTWSEFDRIKVNTELSGRVKRECLSNFGCLYGVRSEQVEARFSRFLLSVPIAPYPMLCCFVAYLSRCLALSSKLIGMDISMDIRFD
ncbi:MAG: hypothetical protein DCF25_15195 [Leptolyngbya foveolarum]|uniref:Uncharacterized protein n=1 Tax=Leptolyngbya foveolarum TaxID=47253 RepID=A0A2W4U4S7_9CYAN|nr:MAG: hypothetical protein DCF25_15195 [Leptolyngbya foveolarum]